MPLLTSWAEQQGGTEMRRGRAHGSGGHAPRVLAVGRASALVFSAVLALASLQTLCAGSADLRAWAPRASLRAAHRAVRCLVATLARACAPLSFSRGLCARSSMRSAVPRPRFCCVARASASFPPRP